MWDPALRARVRALAAGGGGGGGGAAAAAAAAPAPVPTHVLVVGDLNTCPLDMDIFKPAAHRNRVAGFCDAERDGYARLLGDGELVDVWRAANPTTQQFTCEERLLGSRWREGGWCGW